MKNLYAILLAFLPIIATAQTATQSDLPYAGLAWLNAVDSIYSNVIPAGGLNQTWDYTNIQNDVNDTVGFISSVGTPYAGSFSGSNLAAYNQTDGSYTYATTNSSGIYINGIVTSTGTIISYSQASLFIPVPMSYGSTRNSVSRLLIDSTISGTAYRLVSRTESQFTADGTGTLRLPNGDNTGVLRIKSVDLRYDSISINIGGGIYIPLSNSASQTTTFRYIKPGTQPSLIASVYADSLGTNATAAEYLRYSIVLSSPILESRKTTVFPSPADNSISILLTDIQNSTIVIFDVEGKQIMENQVSSLQTTFDTSTLSNGIYFYQIRNGNNPVSNGKFIVKH